MILFIYFDFPRPRSLSHLITYNIKFVQHGLAERVSFQGRIHRDGRGAGVWGTLG